MQKTDLLLAFKTPKQLVEVIAGCVSVLGLFGCFHDSPGMKNLSLAALMAGVGTIVANEAIAGLYAETALHALERELYRSQTAEATAQAQAQTLAAQLDDRIALTQAQTEQLEQLQLQLTETQQSLQHRTTQAETYARDHAQNAAVVQTLTTTLNQQIAALKTSRDRDRTAYRQNLLSLTDHAKATLTEAITHWHTSLTHLLETSANQRPHLLPRLQTLQASAQALSTRYLQQIADLTPAATPQQSLDDILSLLHHGITEFSALKVQHRNALNIADRRSAQTEISQLQTQLQQYQTADLIPRAQHLAILNEFQVKKDEVVDGLITQVDAVAQELQGDTDVYVQLLIQKLEEAARQISHLTAEVDRLTHPHTFHPATREDLRMGNQIIDYFHLHGVILDRAGSEYHKHEATLYFHTDRNPRLILPADLNEHSDKLPQITRCLNTPKFTYDPESGLMSVRLTLSRKPAIHTEDVSRLWKPKSQFEKLAAQWVRIRVTGGSESGKSPTAENIAVTILQARPGTVKLANPQHNSNKNHWTIPVTVTSHKESFALMKELAERVEARSSGTESTTEFVLYLFDEVDSTLKTHKSASTSILAAIKQASHQNLGMIFIGQNANASEYPGLDRSDFENCVNVHLGSNAKHAIENSNMSTDLKHELQKQLDKLTTFCEAKNQELGLAPTDPQAYRFALIIEPQKRPYYLELPAFGSYPFDPAQPVETHTAQTQHSAAPLSAQLLGLPQAEPSRATAIRAENAVISPMCPQCASQHNRKDGSARGIKYSKCLDCGKRFKTP